MIEFKFKILFQRLRGKFKYKKCNVICTFLIAQEPKSSLSLVQKINKNLHRENKAEPPWVLKLKRLDFQIAAFASEQWIWFIFGLIGFGFTHWSLLCSIEICFWLLSDLIPACSNQIQIHLNELHQPGSLELYKQVYRALQAHPEFFPIGLWIIAERQLSGQQISLWFLLINYFFFFFSFEAFKRSMPQSHDVHLTIRFHQLFHF